MNAEVLALAQAFIDRKYTAVADKRQEEMGLAYITAERTDLAREVTRFVESNIESLAAACQGHSARNVSK